MFCKRIYSHSIWFLGDSIGNRFKDERIDIEFQGLVLSAFYILGEDISRDDISMNFIMFIESPIERAEILDQMQPLLKKRILEEIGADLYAIIEKHRFTRIKIKRPNHKKGIESFPDQDNPKASPLKRSGSCR